ncbi:MAG: hypothetical protein J3K34DRAFT_456274 [Monoraphidium minutum]|nr:MAG: hypothetical protein J3K34DRAFT_456274 [Monoraphidium minutum]
MKRRGARPPGAGGAAAQYSGLPLLAALALALAAGVLLLASARRAAPGGAGAGGAGYERGLMEWVRRGGGEVNVRIATKNGLRGVFAARDLSPGDVIVRIPMSLAVWFPSNASCYAQQAASLLRVAADASDPRARHWLAGLPMLRPASRLVSPEVLPPDYLHLLECPAKVGAARLNSTSSATRAGSRWAAGRGRGRVSLLRACGEGGCRRQGVSWGPPTLPANRAPLTPVKRHLPSRPLSNRNTAPQQAAYVLTRQNETATFWAQQGSGLTLEGFSLDHLKAGVTTGLGRARRLGRAGAGVQGVGGRSKAGRGAQARPPASNGSGVCHVRGGGGGGRGEFNAALVPILELANHRNDCNNTCGVLRIREGRGADGGYEILPCAERPDAWAALSMDEFDARLDATERSELCFFQTAGVALKAGDEVCLRYHHLAADDAFFEYGYIPPEPPSAPPLLSRMDGGSFSAEEGNWVPWDAPPPFDGPLEAVESELRRVSVLAARLERTTAAAAAAPRPAAADAGGAMLRGVLDLNRRRAAALRAEAARLRARAGELGGGGGGAARAAAERV